MPKEINKTNGFNTTLSAGQVGYQTYGAYRTLAISAAIPRHPIPQGSNPNERVNIDFGQAKGNGFPLRAGVNCEAHQKDKR